MIWSPGALEGMAHPGQDWNQWEGHMGAHDRIFDDFGMIWCWISVAFLDMVVVVLSMFFLHSLVD